MFGKHLFSEGNFAAYLKTCNAHRALLTWQGVVQVPEENVAAFLEDLYEKNLPIAKPNVEHKRHQSNVAKKRKAEEDSRATSSAQAAKPHLLVLPPFSDQILTLPEHPQFRNQLDLRLQLARGDPMLGKAPHGVTTVTTMGLSVSGPNIEGSGGTEMGPAADGFSGASFLLFPNAVVEIKSDVAW